jgi:hypothetical protein
MTFQADIPGAIVVPAAACNFKTNGTNRPKVLVLHTPEEPADGREGTPAYFSTCHYNARGVLVPASTHYYTSGGQGTLGDGDLYQMVQEQHFAFANGVTRGTRPYPPDTDPALSLNWQSLSNEIEGYAATMRLTCPPGCKQWLTVVRWVEGSSHRYAIPLDRAHVIGHYQVADNRTDPGTLDIDGIVRDAQALRESRTAPAPPEEEDIMDIEFLLDDTTTRRVFAVPTNGQPWQVPNNAALTALKKRHLGIETVPASPEDLAKLGIGA